MTYPLNTYTRPFANVPNADIIGPFSKWPRKPRGMREKAIVAGSVGTLAVFAHCVVPLIS